MVAREVDADQVEHGKDEGCWRDDAAEATIGDRKTELIGQEPTNSQATDFEGNLGHVPAQLAHAAQGLPLDSNLPALFAFLPFFDEPEREIDDRRDAGEQRGHA